jgi:hypothetical protein
MAEPGNAPVNFGETRDLVALRAFRVRIPIPAMIFNEIMEFCIDDKPQNMV